MEPKIVLFCFMMLALVSSQSQGLSSNQSEFFALMKASLPGNGLSDWDLTGGKPFCSFRGVTCNSHGHVEGLNVSGWQLKGRFPGNVCSYLPSLRILDLSRNYFVGNFLNGVFNCSLLEVLNVNSNYLRASVPDFSSMQSLRLLNMSYNLFTGKFPVSFTNLTNLEVFDLNENPELDLWKLPENISRLTKLQVLVLSTCKLEGPIPPSIGNMTALVKLHLAGNFLSGPLPNELGSVKNLQQLYLYYNFFLSGSIPEELGNLTELVEMDISVNQLTGSIPESVCRLPNLQVLQIYNNSLSGEIPRAIESSTALTLLSLYDNYLTGRVPQFVGHLSPLIILELSENNLTGPLPSEACRGGKLQYFLLLDNKLSGKIPDSYQYCKSLVRFRISNNRLEGSIPQGLLSLPHVSIIDLGYNSLSGPVPISIVKAGNLSELFIQSNKLSGVLPPEICRAVTLVKIDLSNNLLSGPVPSEIGNLKRLNLLTLQGNKLNSSIPASLSLLKSLNVLDLSNNLLTGKIPESLTELLPNSINFANNQLSGPIPLSFIKGGVAESFLGNPGLCVEEDVKIFPICSPPKGRKRPNSIWAIGIPSVIIMIGALLFLKRRLSKGRAVMEHDDQTLPSSFFSYTVKSFHRISFDQREILEAMVDKNIVGHGGSGTVYRIELHSGEVVAVKKLWSRRTKDSSAEDQLTLDKGLKTEVETLGSIRHRNIVKLFTYFSSLNCNLLVYEYMPNGNLWDALHKGRIHLDWPTRHQIALGVAQGLSYLHNDLVPPIIHRDIKTTNILLDVNYQPKVADFGIAKVLQARGNDSTTTVIAGTYGYLAPEYAYSNKATTKCDVYSFGVVLMELITGKKPVEADFGENKNIVYWISTKVDTQQGVMEVLDKKLSESFSGEMKQVLRIAMRCTCKNPAQRPAMSEVVHLLVEADPRGFDSRKLSNKTKEAATKTKDTSDQVMQHK